jgi:hypothetical protein
MPHKVDRKSKPVEGLTSVSSGVMTETLDWQLANIHWQKH